MQLLYLGKLSRPKYHEFSLKLLIWPMPQSNKKKLPLYYFTPVIHLTVYKRKITRFIADNKVVYQRVRSATRLASDNSWARRRERCELSCANLNGKYRFHVQSHELIGSFLACPPFWAQILYRFASNAVCSCMPGWRAIPSCEFFSADYRCFQVSNPCREIH